MDSTDQRNTHGNTLMYAHIHSCYYIQYLLPYTCTHKSTYSEHKVDPPPFKYSPDLVFTVFTKMTDVSKPSGTWI